MHDVTPTLAATGLSRRSWLQRSGVAVSALALPEALRARAESGPAPAARAAIVILLQGGLSHLDSWDLKPDAPAEYRGEFDSIATTVPGYRCSEHLPRLAQQATEFNILRSVYHLTPSHEAAIHWVLTGYDYPGANTTTKNRNVKPSMGSIVAQHFGPLRAGLPTYVCVPDRGQLGDRVRYAAASHLGLAYDPFESGVTPTDATTPFALPPNLTLSSDVDVRRFDHRLALLKKFDQLPRNLDHGNAMNGLDEFNKKAWELLAHDATRRAFDLSGETPELRAKYGSHRVGQQTLLARRLAEAGVPFTLVNYATNQDYDTHTDNFNQLKNVRLPQFDQALSTLLWDLETRGLLDTTLVAVVTEFGRTPKINANAGRDHWSDVFSIFLTGGGLKRGRVLGTSNPRGEIPQDRPMHYNEVAATIYRQLGVPTDRVFPDPFGRPVPVLYSGDPIPELL